MSLINKCTQCRLIYDHLRERYWTIQDELLEKATKRRCGRCRLLCSRRDHSLMAKQRLIVDNMRILQDRPICEHVRHCRYADGTIDDGKKSGMCDPTATRSPINVMGRPVGDWMKDSDCQVETKTQMSL